MRQPIIYLSIVLLTFLGCTKDEEKSNAGYFLLTEIQNSHLKSAKLTDDGTNGTEFSLGDIKASKEFYFLISNGGDNPIFDITLSTDHNQFPIAPENISLLPGSNSEGSGNMIPLISLGVLHGIQLNGVGDTDLLPKGENSAVLTITGKTIENNDTIDLESKFIFKVNAKLMDISMFSDGHEIDLLYPTGSGLFGNYGVNGYIRYYSANSDVVEIKNVGNVDITLNETILDDSGGRKDLATYSLLQDQTVTINLLNKFTILEFDSDGTITDGKRIQLSNNGNGYIAFIK